MAPHALEIEMERMESEYLTPEQFLNLTETDRRRIKDIAYAVSPLGSTSLSSVNFGKIKVRWDSPRYVPRFL